MLTSERDEYRERAFNAEQALTKHAHNDRILKLASQMQQKGLDHGRSLEVLVEDLQKMASQGRLDAVEEAVGMQAPDMGAKIASLGEAGTYNLSSLSRLEAAILGDAYQG
jgi:hypothetical protein